MRWTVICMDGRGEISFDHMNGPHGFRDAFKKALEEYGDGDGAADGYSVVALVPGQQHVIGPEVLNED